VRLDEVLSVTAAAVEDLVEPPRRASKIGDDEAAIAAPGGGLDTGDDPALDGPALGGIAEITEPSDLVGTVLDTAECCVLAEIGYAVVEDAVAGEAKACPRA
jgi:hypothetical protein